MSSFLDLWPALLLIAATLSSGLIAGFVIADALTLRDLRRAATREAERRDSTP